MQDDPSLVARHLQCLAQLNCRIHDQPAAWAASLMTRLLTRIAGAPLLEEAHRQRLLQLAGAV
jgi:hypothetical protein